MAVSERVMGARVEQQEKRLAVKKKDPKGYPAWFAAQPAQVVKQQRLEEVVAAKAALATAYEDLEVAEVTGVGIMEAQTAIANTTVLVEQMEAAMSRRTGGASLTARGA